LNILQKLDSSISGEKYMPIYKNSNRSKLKVVFGAITGHLWLPVLFVILSLNGTSLAQGEDQDEGTVQEQGRNSGAAQKDTSRGKAFNLYGREMGMVDSQGKITNAYGSNLGHVDNNGTVFNVSDIVIGKVSGDGMISNQSGTVLGYVNEKGEIFNNGGNKLGEVNGETDIYKIGAVGRIIFFNK
jgi:hypothetical protein